ncbi:DNA helicase II [Verminephrobacter eiseniae]|uniref:DEAD/DEAH box helicase n=1 Tax=Verminephrobacter eiseniae TaxID=364317 RepID=UPI0022376D8D|nr:3'-5' exonuclease [Verminephrobacter eiseniae]MCW5261286.1 DNA helicase II [Verminephrobacter eiseniae]
MAVLIPSLSTCTARIGIGERRLAERLQQKLDDDYLLWFNVPIGPKQCHPDFVVLHPRRGLLILETKDWHLGIIQKASPGDWLIAPDGVPKSVPNPVEQARYQALQVVDALKRDAQLIQHEGKCQGMLTFPWSYGVVFTRIKRKQFDDAGLGSAIESNRVVCADEMLEDAEPEAFQSRLWDMFPQMMRGALSLPQIDRVRWNLFPEVRVPDQGVLFDDADDKATIPDFLRVMDLQQEQLARSLGDGHRVIHGVAGSGKTMILGYRAEYLAKTARDLRKPVLVLCYNEPLAVKLQATMQAKALADRVHVRHFHKWCRDQLVAFGQPLPPNDLAVDAKMYQMVHNVIDGVDRKMIPSGQYLAVLVDEGHDFAPEWLKLVTQMVDPATNSLLLLYDDAQSIYSKRRGKPFSFKSVGVQAQGRTTILKINYRNTRQILQTASAMATELLRPQEKGDDGVPLVQPVSCGRDGPEPIVIDLPSTRAQADRIAELMASAHNEGHAWGDMAVLCRSKELMDECANALGRRRLPHKVRKGTHDFNPAADTIKVMTLHASKGLEFPVVAVIGARQAVAGLEVLAKEEDALEEMRLFYVGATRATSLLMIANAIRQ